MNSLPEKVAVRWSDGLRHGGMHTVALHLADVTVRNDADMRTWPARTKSEVWREETLYAEPLAFEYCGTQHLLELAQHHALVADHAARLLRNRPEEEARASLIALLTDAEIARPSQWYLLRVASATSGLIRPEEGPDVRPLFCSLSYALYFGRARTEASKAVEWLRAQGYEVPPDLAEAVAIARAARWAQRIKHLLKRRRRGGEASRAAGADAAGRRASPPTRPDTPP